MARLAARLCLAAGSVSLAWCISGVQLSAAELAASELPLVRVVMFSSGVGFYTHSGRITGNVEVPLKFNVDDINDLLKSLVLEDRGGGRISTITYGARDPVAKTLKTFAIDLTNDPTVADLLRQVRGQPVEIDAPKPIQGKIVGIERRLQKVGKDEAIEVDVLNLLTATGLRSVTLEDIGEIRFVDEKISNDFQEALSVLADGRISDKRTVTLRFVGKGERPVRVGYVQESPVWKTSYRLMLHDDGPPALQGWAIVENTTEHDWQDVSLTLISGRPISFMMDLYQPLYAARPLVVPELFASLRPQTHSQNLGPLPFQPPSRRAARGRMGGGLGGMGGGMGGGVGGGGGFGGIAPGIPNNPAINSGDSTPIDPGAGVQAVVQADEVGELFRYVIEEPVTLARQQSALLPIVNQEIKGKKLGIYNASVQSKHPLNAVRLTNATKLHLMQGPITVFDGGVYAGDAQIEDLPPDGTRLVSYALDLDTEIVSQRVADTEEIIQASIKKGVLQVRRQHRRGQNYTIKNSGDRTKTLLIEQPIDPAWKLADASAASETTRSLYRFEVVAEKERPTTLSVVEQHDGDTQISLGNSDDATVALYIKAKAISPKIKAALAEVLQHKQQLADSISKQQSLDEEMQQIEQEQSRIRSNMGQLDRTSELYQRYSKKLNQQEDDVERLHEQLRGIIEALAAQRRTLDASLEKLDLE
jgi:hypothetical protein